MQDYDGLYHYDLYRLSCDEIIANGLFENFFENGLHLVEWGDEKLIQKLLKYEISVFIVRIKIYKNARLYELEKC